MSRSVSAAVAVVTHGLQLLVAGAEPLPLAGDDGEQRVHLPLGQLRLHTRGYTCAKSTPYTHVYTPSHTCKHTYTPAHRARITHMYIPLYTSYTHLANLYIHLTHNYTHLYTCIYTCTHGYMLIYTPYTPVHTYTHALHTHTHTPVQRPRSHQCRWRDRCIYLRRGPLPP